MNLHDVHDVLRFRQPETGIRARQSAVDGLILWATTVLAARVHLSNLNSNLGLSVSRCASVSARFGRLSYELRSLEWVLDDDGQTGTSAASSS